ncbi:MAG: DUF1292 domain-containing protein [Oscillospiraceae bacterium]|nr:DUF1292 domain-containing protein [Oscillospiraceae bacterium]
MEDFGAEIISITDEDGAEYELEVLARIEYKGVEYLALTPADAADEAEELEVSLLKSVVDNGEPILVAIEDEEELETVYDLLMEQVFSDEDDELDDDYDD